jgi:hypothetical protein
MCAEVLIVGNWACGSLHTVDGVSAHAWKRAPVASVKDERAGDDGS